MVSNPSNDSGGGVQIPMGTLQPHPSPPPVTAPGGTAPSSSSPPANNGLGTPTTPTATGVNNGNFNQGPLNQRNTNGTLPTPSTYSDSPSFVSRILQIRLDTGLFERFFTLSSFVFTAIGFAFAYAMGMTSNRFSATANQLAAAANEIAIRTLCEGTQNDPECVKAMTKPLTRLAAMAKKSTFPINIAAMVKRSTIPITTASSASHDDNVTHADESGTDTWYADVKLILCCYGFILLFIVQNFRSRTIRGWIAGRISKPTPILVIEEDDGHKLSTQNDSYFVEGLKLASGINFRKSTNDSGLKSRRYRSHSTAGWEPETARRRLSELSHAVHDKNGGRIREIVSSEQAKYAPYLVKECPNIVLVAIELGDCRLVNYLIDQGAEVDSKRLIFPTIRRGQMDLLEILLTRGMNMNEATRDDYGRTPLCAAIRDNRLDIIKRLIEHGIDYHHGEALYEATKGGMHDIMHLLLRSGAPPNEQLKNGDFALSLATRCKDTVATKILLSYKADPNLGSPLLDAVLIGQSSIAELLIAHGAIVNISSKIELNTPRVGLWSGPAGVYADINQVYIVHKGQFHGTKPGSHPFSEYRLSIEGTSMRKSSRSTENISRTPESEAAGPKIDPRIALALEHNSDLLCIAVAMNNVPMVKILLKAGAQLHLPGTSGLRTGAFGVSVQLNRGNIVDLFLQQLANPLSFKAKETARRSPKPVSLWDGPRPILERVAVENPGHSSQRVKKANFDLNRYLSRYLLSPSNEVVSVNTAHSISFLMLQQRLWGPAMDTIELDCNIRQVETSAWIDWLQKEQNDIPDVVLEKIHLAVGNLWGMRLLSYTFDKNLLPVAQYLIAKSGIFSVYHNKEPFEGFGDALHAKCPGSYLRGMILASIKARNAPLAHFLFNNLKPLEDFALIGKRKCTTCYRPSQSVYICYLQEVIKNCDDELMEVVLNGSVDINDRVFTYAGHAWSTNPYRILMDLTPLSWTLENINGGFVKNQKWNLGGIPEIGINRILMLCRHGAIFTVEDVTKLKWRSLLLDHQWIEILQQIIACSKPPKMAETSVELCTRHQDGIELLQNDLQRATENMWRKKHYSGPVYTETMLDLKVFIENTSGDDGAENQRFGIETSAHHMQDQAVHTETEFVASAFNTTDSSLDTVIVSHDVRSINHLMRKSPHLAQNCSHRRNKAWRKQSSRHISPPYNEITFPTRRCSSRAYPLWSLRLRIFVAFKLSRESATKIRKADPRRQENPAPALTKSMSVRNWSKRILGLLLRTYRKPNLPSNAFRASRRNAIKNKHRHDVYEEVKHELVILLLSMKYSSSREHISPISGRSASSQGQEPDNIHHGMSNNFGSEYPRPEGRFSPAKADFKATHEYDRVLGEEEEEEEDEYNVPEAGLMVWEEYEGEDERAPEVDLLMWEDYEDEDEDEDDCEVSGGDLMVEKRNVPELDRPVDEVAPVVLGPSEWPSRPASPSNFTSHTPVTSMLPTVLPSKHPLTTKPDEVDDKELEHYLQLFQEVSRDDKELEHYLQLFREVNRALDWSDSDVGGCGGSDARL